MTKLDVFPGFSHIHNIVTSQCSLGPRMINLCVADISTVLEPSTTMSTKAAFTGLLGDTAFCTLVVITI